MTDPTPDVPTLRRALGLAEHEVALRDLWRDLAEKNIEMGTDWPLIARTLYRDIDRLLAAHPEPVPTPDSADDATVGERGWKCPVCFLIREEPDETIEPGDYHTVDPLHPSRCPSCGMVPIQGSEGAARVAWAREHRTVVRSHGCDSPAPECACGSPATPHRYPATPPADDATVGERKGCGAVSPDEDWVPGVWEAHDHLCVTHARDEHECACGARWDATPDADDTPPPADDANRAPVSGGLDEGGREATEYAIVNDWLVEVVNEHTCGTGSGGHYGAHEPGCGMVPVANIAAALKAERDTARREAGERIAAAKAEALRAAADEWKGGPTGEAPIPRWWLRDRADALTSDDGSGA